MSSLKERADEKAKNKKKSLLSSIMTFGARDKAKKAKPEGWTDKSRIRNFSLKRK